MIEKSPEPVNIKTQKSSRRGTVSDQFDQRITQMNTDKEGIGCRFQIPDNGSIPNSKMQGGAKRRSFLDLAVEFSLGFGNSDLEPTRKVDRLFDSMRVHLVYSHGVHTGPDACSCTHS